MSMFEATNSQSQAYSSEGDQAIEAMANVISDPFALFFASSVTAEGTVIIAGRSVEGAPAFVHEMDLADAFVLSDTLQKSIRGAIPAALRHVNATGNLELLKKLGDVMIARAAEKNPEEG